jgi:hypothetical protein
MGMNMTREAEQLKDGANISDLLSIIEIFSKNTENGNTQAENRVKFFLTILTGTIGIFSYFLKIVSAENNLFIGMLAWLFILLFYGLSTFNKLNWVVIYKKIDQQLLENILKTLGELHPNMEIFLKNRQEIITKIDNNDRLLYNLRGIVYTNLCTLVSAQYVQV